MADVQGDAATVWSSSQGTHGLRANLAKVFGLSPQKVRVVFLDGVRVVRHQRRRPRRRRCGAPVETIGQPVRVQWTRQDETGWDPKGPQQLLDVRAGLDAGGRIVAWDTQMWLPNQTGGARALLAAEAAGLPQEHGTGAGAITQNGDPPYQADSVRVVVHWIEGDAAAAVEPARAGKDRQRVRGRRLHRRARGGRRRGSGRVPPGAADRSARHRGHSTDRAGIRLAAANVAESSNAARAVSSIGRGIAYMRYKQAENYVAIAMDVAVRPATGRIDVRRVVCAHDCGLIVNPDALRNQVEGCIVQTLSRALHEEVTFDRSRVTSVDWASYPILRFPEAPQVDVILIDRPDQPLLGAGEAATAPVAAALANAVFDATGVRLRTVPFTAGAGEGRARKRAQVDRGDRSLERFRFFVVSGFPPPPKAGARLAEARRAKAPAVPTRRRCGNVRPQPDQLLAERRGGSCPQTPLRTRGRQPTPVLGETPSRLRQIACSVEPVGKASGRQEFPDGEPLSASLRANGVAPF